MTKQELITSITHSLLDENLLNQADFYDVVALVKEVEKVLTGKLHDYTIITTNGIIPEK